ncbi:MAG: lipase family protein [Acidobacteria bacterium]|nr:lipase family protein [Acidobacteriota bacterium]
MDFDNSWQALLKPGTATSFFDVHGQSKFQVDVSGFSLINAWWLAELSRLIYKLGADETPSPPAGPARNEVLNRVGLQEVKFIRSKTAQCALIKTLPQFDDQFRVLVFRGTDELIDWLSDLNALPVEWEGAGLVHQGFRDALETVWPEIKQALEADNSPVFYTGHSLGASMATLAAAKISPHAVYTFGSPFTGNEAFVESLSGVKVYRVANNRDVVPTVPPLLGLRHVGELHYIAHDGQFVVDPDDLSVAMDRLKKDAANSRQQDFRKFFTDAPELLADHAPVNYVAHLERAI